MTADGREKVSGPPDDAGTKAGGGWLFLPCEDRFVDRSRNL
jgi:hypothetical protein